VVVATFLCSTCCITQVTLGEGGAAAQMAGPAQWRMHWFEHKGSARHRSRPRLGSAPIDSLPDVVEHDNEWGKGTDYHGVQDN